MPGILKKIYYLLFILLISNPSYSEKINETIDSLEALLISAKDTQNIDILNDLSILYSEKEPDKGLQYGTKALNESQRLKYKKGEANALIAIGLAHIYNKEFEKGIANLEFGLKKSEALGTGMLSIQALSYLGSSYKSTNQFDKAIEKYLTALELASKSDDKTQIGKILNNLGSIYSSKGNYKKALEYYLRSLDVKIEINDKEGIANSYNNIGIIYKNWGKYDKALEYQHKSISIKEALNDSLGLALSYLNIGVIYKNLEKYSQALEYFDKALKISEKVNDRINTAKAYNNIGNLYAKLGNLTEALNYLMQALDIFKITNDRINAAKANNNIGNLYSSLGDNEKALYFYQKGLEIQRQIGDRYGISISLLNIGNIYYRNGRSEVSEKYLLECLDIAVAENIMEVEKDAFSLLSDIAAKKGNFQLSLDYYKKYESVKDSINSIEARKKISEMELRYDFSQKEKEIELLKKDSEIKKDENKFLIVAAFLLLSVAVIVASIYFAKKRNSKLLKEKNYELKLANEKLLQSESELKELNSTKDKYFSIIAHDLRNPISVFLSICDYISKRFNELSRNELKEHINDLNESAKNVLDLLENMLEWSLSQTGKMKFNPERFDLYPLVENNLSLLNVNAKNKNIELTANINDKSYVYADARMVNAILRNLISNAIKFTPNGGKVNIFTTDKNGLIHVSIADNGVGMSKEDKDKLFRMDVHFTTAGTSAEKGTGLGLILCKEWVEKNGGYISVESELGKGSVFTFTLQRSNDAQA